MSKLTSILLLLSVLLRVSDARAGDAGADAAQDIDAATDAAMMAPDTDAAAASDAQALACDGALCDSIGPQGVRNFPGGCSFASDAAPGAAWLAVIALVVVARRRRGAILLALTLVGSSSDARADVVPPSTDIPSVLTLDEALRIFRARGLDLLIAEANVRGAEGVVKAAGASPNPSAGATVGYAPTYQPNDPSCLQNNSGCSNTIWSASITDNAALSDLVTGKRDLRLQVARAALAAAKMNRADAERSIAFQVKSAYAQVGQAALALKFAKEVAESYAKLLDLFKTKLTTGSINLADYARVENQKLEAEQAFDLAQMNLRQARVALAFLLGVRGGVPDFEVDSHALDFRVPPQLASASEEVLLRRALEQRPDLLAAGYQKQSSMAQIDLVMRQRIPDVAFSFGYAAGGYGGLGTNGSFAGPQMFTLGISVPIPAFYQLQGELMQARAQNDINSLAQAKLTAQVISDVSTAYAGYVTARKLVERMETGGLLRSARDARDITRIQFEKGSGSLTDVLLAQQAFIQTNVEYIGDLSNYWVAVYQLEQATAKELR